MTMASKPQLVYQIIIKAPQERVWEAITKSEFTSRYYYGCTLKTDLTVGSPGAGPRLLGGALTLHLEPGAGQPALLVRQGVVGLAELPEILVHDFRKNGYLPEALLNFLALLGWSPGENRELMTIVEMVSLFSLDRLRPAFTDAGLPPGDQPQHRHRPAQP